MVHSYSFLCSKWVEFSMRNWPSVKRITLYIFEMKNFLMASLDSFVLQKTIDWNIVYVWEDNFSLLIPASKFRWQRRIWRNKTAVSIALSTINRIFCLGEHWAASALAIQSWNRHVHMSSISTPVALKRGALCRFLFYKCTSLDPIEPIVEPFARFSFALLILSSMQDEMHPAGR